MRIKTGESTALIIDIQEKLFPHIHDHDVLARNTGILLEGFKILGIPVIVTEQYTRGLGFTIPQLKSGMEGIVPLEKTSFSCCDDPGFNEAFGRLDKKYIIIAGIETHVCVLQTAVDLLEKGFIPVIVEDCVSSRNLNDKQIAIERMRQEGALITTYESILFELTRYSGTADFKAISKLVK